MGATMFDISVVCSIQSVKLFGYALWAAIEKVAITKTSRNYPISSSYTR